MVSGDSGGQVSCITDRCQIKKQSLGSQANGFQDVAGALAWLRLSERTAPKKQKRVKQPHFYCTDREEWNLRREVATCTASVACKSKESQVPIADSG